MPLSTNADAAATMNAIGVDAKGVVAQQTIHHDRERASFPIRGLAQRRQARQAGPRSSCSFLAAFFFFAMLYGSFRGSTLVTVGLSPGRCGRGRDILVTKDNGRRRRTAESGGDRHERLGGLLKYYEREAA
jgi:hypothetical protein